MTWRPMVSDSGIPAVWPGPARRGSRALPRFVPASLRSRPGVRLPGRCPGVRPLVVDGSVLRDPLQVTRPAQQVPVEGRVSSRELCHDSSARLLFPGRVAEGGRGRSAGMLARVSPGSSLVGMSEGSLSFDAEITDHQVIFRAGQVEAVVVPLEEYRALKALEQREAELYWVAHESRYPSRPGDDVPDGKLYDSMEALVADLGAGE
jgi:hypothetical protein